VKATEQKAIRCLGVLVRRVRALDLHPIDQAELFRAMHTIRTVIMAQIGQRYEGVPEPVEPEQPPAEEPQEPTVAEIKAKATKKAIVLGRPSSEALRKIAESDL
jgi:hypothetical protein